MLPISTSFPFCGKFIYIRQLDENHKLALSAVAARKCHNWYLGMMTSCVADMIVSISSITSHLLYALFTKFCTINLTGGGHERKFNTLSFEKFEIKLFIFQNSSSLTATILNTCFDSRVAVASFSRQVGNLFARVNGCWPTQELNTDSERKLPNLDRAYIWLDFNFYLIQREARL